MKTYALIFSLILVAIAQKATADAYIIIYATHDGKTGHAGIAIDRYDILVHDNDEHISAYDSIKTGRLYYYDFWTKHEGNDWSMIAQDLEPDYYKFPTASTAREITLATLSRKSIPHKKDYPPDGIIRIKTQPWQDFQLCLFLDAIIERQPKFNALRFNCTDFVANAAEFVTGQKVDAREPVFYVRVRTPNQLFKAVSKLENAIILKDPGDKINGSFLTERILKRG